MLMENFAVGKDLASFLFSMPFLIGAILLPFFGILVDKVNKRSLFLVMASIGMMVTCALTYVLLHFFTFTYTNFSFLGPMILLGLSYTAFSCCIWSAIPIVAPEKHLQGTAFGLAVSA
jgi:MFS family permease